MPVLHERSDGAGLYLTTSQEGQPPAFALTAEGERFLTLVLGLKPGDACRVSDLNLLVERGWAEPWTAAEAPGRDRLGAEPIAAPAAETAPPPPSEPAPAGAGEARPHPGRRTRAREIALQVLYLLEQNPGVDPAEVDRFYLRRLHDPKLRAFARALVEGVAAHRAHIDGLIAGTAENWRLDRMAAIDRNILRLGAFEMLYRPDVPTKVAINEALELAKRYSTSQSSRFVNGILDRLQDAMPEGADRGEPEPAAPPPADADG